MKKFLKFLKNLSYIVLFIVLWMVLSVAVLIVIFGIPPNLAE